MNKKKNWQRGGGANILLNKTIDNKVKGLEMHDGRGLL